MRRDRVKILLDLKWHACRELILNSVRQTKAILKSVIVHQLSTATLHHKAA